MTDDPVVYKEVCTIATQTDDNGCNNSCTSMYINVVHVIHSTGESIQVVLDDSRGIEADLDNGLYDGGTEETDKDMEGIKILEETDADHFDGGRIKEGNCHRKKNVAIINDANEDRDRGTKNFEKITSEGNSISTAQDKIIQLQKGYLKLNNEDENIECFHCKKKFTHKNNLKRHLRIHSGEKPFQCSLCKKKFSRNHDLKRHLRLHNGEKPFECSHCAKRFTAKSNLNAHIRKYSGVKKVRMYVKRYMSLPPQLYFYIFYNNRDMQSQINHFILRLEFLTEIER
ncbi:zinc finger protein Xfin-like isoform X2 [Exaiptasia diaphana]|uniref:C2H2-type domain-containing protein n=1 Tax=Exaiptasia diaphana TaxID=2652724 RepID=A0A913YS89_EXADI|nr:zinc finger protein Xfin-like isoform X2 [Exaiptasia diaphana]